MIQIVYSNDDFEVARFRHIDIECVYGECIEISEGNEYFQKLLDCFETVDLELEEVVLFQKM